MKPAVVSVKVGYRTSLEVEWLGDEGFVRVAEGSFCRETQTIPRQELAEILHRLGDAVKHGGEAEAAAARARRAEVGG